MCIASERMPVARCLPFAAWSILLVVAALTTSPPRVWSQAVQMSACEARNVLPAPPEQSAAWTAPPTKLSKTLVSATVHLFQLGLADPRGCEYREIEVLVGGYAPEWKDAVVRTHGWVIPAAPKQPQRFGVCWNGLVYPLTSIGKTADLRTDALAAAKAEKQTNQGITGWYWMGHHEQRHLCNPNEARAVSHESPLPTKACLLLRLGEVELAENLWRHWTETLPKDTAIDKPATANRQHVRDPYVVLANCWALALLDRARAAHLRADDRLALDAAETLARIRPAARAEARRRGFAQEEMEDSVLTRDFDGGILTDQRRRAKDRRQKAGPAVRADEYPDPAKFWERFRHQLDRCPDRSHRIAFLIRQMEEVSSHEDPGNLLITTSQGMFSGVIPMVDHDPAKHPIPLLLAAEGDDAVEPLLACLERDDRLTRWRPYVESFPVGVTVLAKGALEQTLKLPLPEFKADGAESDNGSESREAIVARVRTYWNRYKGMPLADRWYGILIDDRAREQWLAAARTIVQPANVPVTLDSVRYGVRDDLVRDRGKIHGDPLRNKSGPSVAELMTKRVNALNAPYYELLARRRKRGEQQDKWGEEVNDQREELHQREYDCWASVGQGCDMALCLAPWDPAAALPVLRKQTDLCSRLTVEVVGDPLLYDFQGCLLQLLVARIDIGDLNALDEYVAWVRSVKPDSMPGTRAFPDTRQRLGKTFAPLWQHADHAAIAEAAQWLFNSTESPFNPMIRPENDTDGETSLEPLRSPLLALPAFRKQVARLLEDRRNAGQVEVISNEEIRTSLQSDQSLTTSTVPNDPLCPPPGTKAAFRVCDLCAYGLSTMDGVPKCELFWPKKERDRAVEACAAFLRQYGHRFRPAPQTYPFGDPYQVRLALPIRDRPATPEDVRRGEAIFSFAGQGTVRVCRMPRLPLAARWTTWKDHPVLREVWDEAAPNKWRKTVGYEQDGIVWQAEEVRSGNRWRRYYGFVGRYGVAKVPAEEIEFPAHAASTVGLRQDCSAMDYVPLDGAFDVGWTTPGTAPGAVYRIGTPLVCRMLVRNRTGLERTLPPLTRGDMDARPSADAVAIEVHLCRMEPLAWSNEHTKEPWAPLVPRKPERLIFNQPKRALAPGEEFAVLRCDLNEQFGPLRPGAYGFRMKLVGNKKTRSAAGPDVFFMLMQSEPKSP